MKRARSTRFARSVFHALALVALLATLISSAVWPSAAAPIPAHRNGSNSLAAPDLQPALHAPGAQPLAGLPLAFLPNAGQADSAVRFQTQGLGGSVAFTQREVVVRLAPAAASAEADLHALLERSDPRAIRDRATAAMASADAAPAAPVEMRIVFDGANPAPELVALQPLPGHFNYYASANPAAWRTNVPMYAGVAYRDLYPGVTLQYDGSTGQLKGTYLVAPGADPAGIRWRYAGATDVHLDVTGALIVRQSPEAAGIREPAGFDEQPPVAWQVIGGQNVDVPVRFTAHANGAYGFEFPQGYDKHLPLVVDPTIEFSTFVNGSLFGPVGSGIAVDSDGNILVSGFITCNCQAIDDDLVVYKLSPDGKQLLYMSVLGGSVGEYARTLAVSAAGYAYVTGYTFSVDFPVSATAFQSENAGNASCAQFVTFNVFDCADAYLVVLNENGQMAYATYLGGSNFDGGYAVGLDNDSNVYIGGSTAGVQSLTFPTTGGAYQSAPNSHPDNYYDGFVAKFAFDPQNGYILDYSTYLSGSGDDAVLGMAVDGAGNAYPTGSTTSSGFLGANTGDIARDTFVAKLDPTGSQIVWASGLGGHSGEVEPGSGFVFSADIGEVAAVDPDGNNVWIAGVTEASDFPAMFPIQGGPGDNGEGDGFVARFDSEGQLTFSSYLGGNREDVAFGLAVDGDGNAYVSGTTQSDQGFPISNAIQPVFGGGSVQGYFEEQDAWVAHIIRTVHGFELDFSTYLGGQRGDGSGAVAVGPSGDVYVTGFTRSSNFPTTPGVYQPTLGGYMNGFVTRLAQDRPVVFLPGITASNLGLAPHGDTEYWLGNPNINHSELALLPGNPEMVASDVIYKEYGKDIYQSFINAMKDAGFRLYELRLGGNGQARPERLTTAGCDVSGQQANRPNFFVFPYDWRRSNDVNADRLNDYLGCIRKFYKPNTKINIIAHSMGGMLSRRFILKYPGNVNGLITVGGPLLGGPKLTYVLETGWFLGLSQPAVILPGTLQEILETFPAAHQIIPARGWFDQGGSPILVEEGVDLDGNGRTNDRLNYPTTMAVLDARHRRGGVQPGSITRKFRELDYGGRQENWSADPPGVRTFHIFGQSGSADTVNQVVASTFVSCTYYFGSDCEDSKIDGTYFGVRYGSGDQTVPVLSALRVGAAGNYNAPGARLMPCISTATSPNTEHTTMLHNPAIQKAILQFLGEANGGPQRAVPAAQDCGAGVYTLLDAEPNAPHASLAQNAIQEITTEAYYLTLHGVASVVVSDTLGNSTQPLPGDLLSDGVPGVNITPVTSDGAVQQLVIPTGAGFTVTFQTLPRPLGVLLTRGTDTSTSQAIRYRDLALSPATTVRLIFAPEGVQALESDADGDGVFETTHAPTAAVSGALAADVTPPDVTIEATPGAGGVDVTVTAQDAESGVATVYYSLDSTLYRVYTGTITIDPVQTPAVYAFANDAVANRSQRVVAYMPNANAPDLTLAVARAGAFTAGGTAGYEITVSNLNPIAATGPISVTDILPGGMSLQSAGGSDWSCSTDANGVVTCLHPGPAPALGQLPVLSLGVAVGGLALPMATNFATVSAADDPNPLNNTASDEVTVRSSADLTLTSTHTDPFVTGQTGVYSLTVHNAGPHIALGTVTVVDTLPAGLSFQSATGDGWSCTPSGQDVTCTTELPIGANDVLPALSIDVYVDQAAFPGVTNTASVSAAFTDELNPADNTTADPTTVVLSADLSLYKSHDGVFTFGGEGVYKLSVVNNGPFDAAGPITVSDTLPAGTSYTGATGDGWNCSAVGQLVTCSHPGPVAIYDGLPNLQLTVQVAPDAPNILENRATVSGTTFDPYRANDVSSDYADVRIGIDLAIVKQHSGVFIVGQTGAYTLRVSNLGPGAVPTGTVVSVSDYLPYGLALESVEGSGWTCSGYGSYASCEVNGPVEAGQVLPDITLVVTVAAEAAPQVTNEAAVRIQDDGGGGNRGGGDGSTQLVMAPRAATDSATYDLNPENNYASDITDVQDPNATPTDTPTATDTPEPVDTATPTETPGDTPTPTEPPTVSPSDTPTSTPTDTPTSTPTNTATPTPADTPANTATPTPTDTPANTATPTPTDTPTATPPAGTGRIETLIWDDLNGDGIQNAGEPGIGAVQVELVLSSSGTVVATQLTEADGIAAFEAVTSNRNYKLRYTLCDGCSFSPRDRGDDDTIDSDARVNEGAFGTTAIAFKVNAGQTVNSFDAAMRQPGMVVTFVWNDRDNDGLQDPGEEGVVNASVELLDVDNSLAVIAVAQTNEAGLATFSDVATGLDLKLRYALCTGCSFANRNQGDDDAIDSDAKVNEGATGSTAAFRLSKGSQTFDTTDAGMRLPGRVETFVWLDVNRNGLQDDGATGRAGVMVELLDVDDGNTVIAAATTGANGTAVFTDVPTNVRLRLRYTKPAGYTFTSRDQGGDDTVDSDARANEGAVGTTAQSFRLVNGSQVYTDADAGLKPA